MEYWGIAIKPSGLLECWSMGILENWSIGVMEHWGIAYQISWNSKPPFSLFHFPLLHYSITPLLHISTTPLLLYSNTPSFQYSITPILHFFLPAFCSPGEKSPNLGVFRFSEQFLGIPLGRHRIAVHIEIDGIVPNGKDARQLMGDDDDG